MQKTKKGFFSSSNFPSVHLLQLLAMLLKKKRSLLNSHILHLTFSLVGTVDSGHETSIIPNSTAFQDLLCDFEVRACGSHCFSKLYIK